MKFLFSFLAVSFLSIDILFSQSEIEPLQARGVSFRGGRTTNNTRISTGHDSRQNFMISNRAVKREISNRSPKNYDNPVQTLKQKTPVGLNPRPSNQSKKKESVNPVNGRQSENNNSGGIWGVGVRLGDPAGISVKKYSGNEAIEFSFGRSHWWYYGKGWYDRRFNDWYKEKKFGYAEFDYLSYDPSFPFTMQLHFLFHRSFNQIDEKEIKGKLRWYYGLGGQFGFQTFDFNYRYKETGNSSWVHSSDRVTDIDLSGNGVLGLEYTFSEFPVSLFSDLVLSMEVVDNPFLFWLQGGIGIRYNF